MLRGLIPHGDQKRDKASFLLEVHNMSKCYDLFSLINLVVVAETWLFQPFCPQVIEYIQFLQDKVQKYEGPFHGWNNEPPKLMPWVKYHPNLISPLTRIIPG